MTSRKAQFPGGAAAVECARETTDRKTATGGRVAGSSREETPGIEGVRLPSQNSGASQQAMRRGFPRPIFDSTIPIVKGTTEVWLHRSLVWQALAR